MTCRSIWACWMLLPAVFSWAQNNEEEILGIAESFTVRTGTVEVVVTDNDSRVIGLERDDFLLKVDGISQRLTYFDEIRNDNGAQIASGESVASLLATESPGYVVPSMEAPRYFLVFIDDWFTNRRYRAKIFKRIQKQVKSMGPKDYMAVVRFAGDRLEVLTRYNNDKTHLTKILRKASDLTPADQLRFSRLKTKLNIERNVARLYSDVENAPDSVEEARLNTFDAVLNSETDDKELDSAIARLGSRTTGNLSIDNVVQQLEAQVLMSVNAVCLGMRSMVQKGGRQMLLLVSSGWPNQFEKALNIGGQRQGERINAESGLELIAPVSDTANTLGYTIYPMLLSQTESGLFGSRELPITWGRTSNTLFENIHDGFDYLARVTGGQLINKAHREPLPLMTVLRDSQGYYTLGFLLPDDQPGKRRKIEVEVTGGYDVRYRESYRLPSQEEKENILSEAALLIGARNDLDVTMGEKKNQGWGRVVQDFSIKIPMERILVKRIPQGYKASFRLVVAAEDGGGARSELLSAPFDIIGRAKPLRGTFAFYDASLLMRKRKQTLVFSLHDSVGGTTLTSTLPFEN